MLVTLLTLTRAVGKLPVQRCCFNGANVGGIVTMVIMVVVRMIMIVTKSWMTRMMVRMMTWMMTSKMV